MSSQGDDIRALLPEFVNGHLDADDAQRVREIAEQDPDIAAEIAFYRHLSNSLKGSADNTSPGELGWARLSRAIDTHEQDMRIEAVKNPPANSRIWRYAAIAMGVVLVGQLPFLLVQEDAPADGFVQVSEAPVAAHSVQVIFAEGAKEVWTALEKLAHSLI